MWYRVTVVRSMHASARGLSAVVGRIWPLVTVAFGGTLVARLSGNTLLTWLLSLPSPALPGFRVPPIDAWPWQLQLSFCTIVGLVPTIPIATHLAVWLLRPELTTLRRCLITAVAVLCFAAWLRVLPRDNYQTALPFIELPALEAVLVGGLVEAFACSVLLFPVTLAVVLALFSHNDATAQNGAGRCLGFVVAPAVLSIGLHFSLLWFLALFVAIALWLTAEAISRMRANATWPFTRSTKRQPKLPLG